MNIIHIINIILYGFRLASQSVKIIKKISKKFTFNLELFKIICNLVVVNERMYIQNHKPKKR